VLKLKGEIEEWNTVWGDARDRITEMTVSQEDLTAQRDSALASMHLLTKEKSDVEKHLRLALEEVAQMGVTMSTVGDARSSAEEELMSVQRKLSEMEEERNLVLQQAQELKHAVERTTILASSAVHQSRLGIVNTLQKKKSQELRKGAQYEQMQVTMQELKTELSSWKLKHSEIQTTYSKLQREYNVVVQERTRLDEDLTASREQVRLVGVEGMGYSAKLDVSAKALARVQAELDRLRTESGGNLGALQAELRRKEAALKLVQENSAVREQENAKLSARNLVLEGEVRSLQGSMKLHQQRAESLEVQLASGSTGLTQAEVEIRRLRTEVQQFQTSRQQQDERYKDMEAENSQLRENVKKLRAELAATQAGRRTIKWWVDKVQRQTLDVARQVFADLRLREVEVQRVEAQLAEQEQRMTKAADESGSSLGVVQNKVVILQAKFSQTEIELGECRKQLDIKTEEHARAVRELEFAQQSQLAAKTKQEKLLMEIAEWKEEASNAQAAAVLELRMQHEANILQLKTEGGSSADEASRLTVELREWHEVWETSKKRITALETRQSQDEMQLERASAENKALASELEELRRDREELELAVADVLIQLTSTIATQKLHVEAKLAEVEELKAMLSQVQTSGDSQSGAQIAAQLQAQLRDCNNELRLKSAELEAAQQAISIAMKMSEESPESVIASISKEHAELQRHIAMCIHMIANSVRGSTVDVTELASRSGIQPSSPSSPGGKPPHVQIAEMEVQLRLEQEQRKKAEHGLRKAEEALKRKK